MSTVSLTFASFEPVVAQAGVVLVEFWVAGCAACDAFDPVYERVSVQHRDHCFARVDVEAEPALAETFGVTAVPTLMVFRDGVPLVREPGALDEAGLEALISSIEALDMVRIHQAVTELVRETARAPEHTVH
jgi:thioredoxin 1